MMEDNKVRGHSRVGNTHQSVSYDPFLGLVNYYLPVYQRLLGKGSPVDRLTQEEQAVGLYSGEPLARNIIALVEEGKTRGFGSGDDLLHTKGNRLYIPRWDNVRKELIKECHDSLWAGHPGLAQPIAVRETMGECLSMDFITCLPKVEGSGSIIVVMDRFSKYATFIPASTDCTQKKQQSFSSATSSSYGAFRQA
ncbi:hypothetical protein Pint_36575 [Pistacia integerrima]|uniref:Uncharacterized protein n=1 Tax=Pistacia integerrima TaxID=434235 RepID=A0ACC0Y5X5_9ROSI|nr:hypothetical protein Pint_36575 [Pistacia integerrima]